MRFTIDRLDHLVLTVRDIDITATWYQRVLGMEDALGRIARSLPRERERGGRERRWARGAAGEGRGVGGCGEAARCASAIRARGYADSVPF